MNDTVLDIHLGMSSHFSGFSKIVKTFSTAIDVAVIRVTYRANHALTLNRYLRPSLYEATLTATIDIALDVAAVNDHCASAH